MKREPICFCLCCRTPTWQRFVRQINSGSFTVILDNQGNPSRVCLIGMPPAGLGLHTAVPSKQQKNSISKAPKVSIRRLAQLKGILEFLWIVLRSPALFHFYQYPTGAINRGYPACHPMRFESTNCNS
jgi:hypothetical protein